MIREEKKIEGQSPGLETEEKKTLKEKTLSRIDRERDQSLAFLLSLLKVPSRNGQPTYAQELVKMKLEQMGFQMDVFPCEVDSIREEPDFDTFPLNLEYHPEIENVVGMREGQDPSSGSFLIHAHIDTLCPDRDPPICVKDGRVYGLGSADDKSGVAMMLLAAQAVLRECGDLKGKLILMSTIGKRGAVGTLTAFRRGYHADRAIYFHPAETGHGFHEIKNYSMGVMDFNITVAGKAGVFRNEIDDSEVNAAEKGALVMQAVRSWDRKRRCEHFFTEGSYAGLPDSKVNILDAWADHLTREEPEQFHLKCSMYFGLGESVEFVLTELKAYLDEALSADSWLSAHPPTVELGEQRATPVSVSRDTDLVRDAEKNIAAVTGDDHFIYQYHGSSDIRMPIVYGNTPTIGLGPLCGGLNGGDEPEWIDIEDFYNGIKIAASMIIDFCA